MSDVRRAGPGEGPATVPAAGADPGVTDGRRTEAFTERVRRWAGAVRPSRAAGHRDALEEQLRRSYDHSQQLLAASEAFNDTVTVSDVRRRISELVTTELRPSYVGLAVLDGDGRLERVRDTRFSPGVEDTGPWHTYSVDAAFPTATALRERRIVAYPDRPRFDADHPEPVRRILRDLGLHAVLAVPLPHVRGPLGVLVLGWDRPHQRTPTDLLTVTTLAGYAAQALDRAQRLQQRDSVAHQLQQAMLTTLPEVPGLVLSARYRPADTREDVGGDWYDAAPVPDPAGRLLAISVGDVVGHNLAAATVMGQVRSMLRQAAWDHPGEPPSRTLDAFECAAAGLGLTAVGTALLAHLRPERLESALDVARPERRAETLAARPRRAAEREDFRFPRRTPATRRRSC